MTNLDEALERLHLTDLEYAGGLANHGPMAVEALEGLGHQALIPAFLDLYVPRLPLAETGQAMSEPETESALGRIERCADWVATYEARLEGGDWTSVLTASLSDLMPGAFAAAGHGFLRVAHAVRNLEREDSPLRRRELARGLAYWSARYQPLPGLPGSQVASGQTLDDFFHELPLVGEPEARAGFFFDSVKRLESFPGFSRSIEAMPLPAADDIDAFLGALCRWAAKLYCAHSDRRIVYVHALTLPVALRGLLGYLDSSVESNAKGRAALHVLQSVAALHAVHGDVGASLDADTAAERDAEVVEMAESWDEIRYRAACSIQEHAIKMTEACLRADRLSPDPIYRIAAADSALRIEGSRGSGSC